MKQRSSSSKTQAEVKAKLSVAFAESQQLDVSRSGEYTVPRIGSIKLNKLTSRREIQKLYKGLLENGRLRKKQRKKHPPLSSFTVRGVHIMLHSALDRAVKVRLLIRNSADSCVVPKVQHQAMKALRPENLKAYLGAAERRNALAMFYLELVSGIRKGELVALRWENLDVEQRTISVSKQATKDAGLEHLRFHDLRHTFATLALQNGVDIKTVSAMLGHYDAGFTLRTYTHTTRQKQDEAAQTMGNLMAQVR